MIAKVQKVTVKTAHRQYALKPSSPESYDLTNVRDLWETSERLVRQTAVAIGSR